MTAELTAAGVIVALANATLVAICWRSRSVLGGVLGLIGVPLAVYAILAGVTRPSSEQALLVAAGALVLGVALLSLGRALERLLDSEPGDET